MVSMNQDLFPIWQGRFQPFQLGHFYVAKQVLSRYGRVIVALVVPDPKRYPEKYEKFFPPINPFTYFERSQMVLRSFEYEGIDTIDKVYVCPMWGLATAFKREQPYFPPPRQRLFIMTQIREDNYPKIAMIKQWGGQVEVFRDIPSDIKGLDATLVRDNILNFKEWRHLVPKGTASVIDEYGLEERVREATSWGW